MENKTSYRGFKELECWKKGRELRIKISGITQSFPKEETFYLTAQIKKSSRSITANIAECYERCTYNDMRHFFIQSRGSATETIDHIITAFDEGYVNEETCNEVEILAETVFKLINGFIAYLDKSRLRTSKVPIPNP